MRENRTYTRQRYLFKSNAILLWGIALLLFSCENKIERIKELAASDKLPGVEAENFEMIQSDSSKIKFRLNTPLMVQYDEDEEEPYTEFPKGVKIEQFGPDMQVVSKITANYARVFDKEDKWIAKNNVVVINQSGDSLKTEELIWEKATGKIYSEKFVKIIREDQIINGIGFESDQNMSNWEIKKVKGTLYMEVPE